MTDISILDVWPGCACLPRRRGRQSRLALRFTCRAAAYASSTSNPFPAAHTTPRSQCSHSGPAAAAPERSGGRIKSSA
jgi:hypothetical protein